MFFDKIFKASKKVLPLQQESSSVIQHQDVKESIEDNLEKLVLSIGNPDDLIIHRIEDYNKTEVVVVYFETLTDGNLLGQQVIEPINKFLNCKMGTLNHNQMKLLLYSANLVEYDNLHYAIDGLLAGQALILLANVKQIFAVSLPGFPRRAIEEAQTEKQVKGPREGFNENLNDNISLIRRWLKDPNLRLEKKRLGERTKTEVAVIYLNDVADPDIVKEVHKRLNQIKIDGILESGYIAELISDNRLTIFPLVQETERPDKVVSALLEGRVAILVDKSSYNIIVPVTANEYYQTSEDFYFNWITGTALRIIRAIGTIIAVTLPGFYIAMITVNPELLPPSVVLLESSARTQVPFPAIFELIITFFAFEVLREASGRFPTNLNMILGVGGGIIMGIAAIDAGLVSGISVAIVVFCTLSTFTTANPSMEQAWRWVRYILFLAGGIFGFIGVIAAGVLILAHMAGLKSFGVSYLAPWAPPKLIDMVDAPIRLPWWLSYRRPPTYRPQQEDRLGTTKGEDEA